MMIRALAFASLFLTSSLSAEYGRVYMGPAAFRMSMTGEKRATNMYGVRMDGCVQAVGPLVVKPNWATLKGKDAKLRSSGAALGLYIPVTEQISLIPHTGVQLTRFTKKVYFQRSTTRVWGCDLCAKISDSLSTTLTISRGQMKASPKFSGMKLPKESYKGYSFASTVDWEITRFWSASVTAGFDHKKTATGKKIRGTGVRVGTAFNF